MRAFVCRTLSEDWSGAAVEEVPQPQAQPREVLVRVAAAAVNFPDLLMCQGKYQYKPDPPFICGMEAAGEIVALGAGVTDWRVGDRVVGGARIGAFAEYLAVPAAALKHKPAQLDMAQAAAYGAAYLTAYVALVRRGALQAGETLLVHGAAGGVGLAAVDLGKLRRRRRRQSARFSNHTAPITFWNRPASAKPSRTSPADAAPT